MCAQFEMMDAFIEEVRNTLLAALRGAVFGLQSGMEIVCVMMNADEIKETSLVSQSMLTLDDAMFAGAKSGEDIL